MRSPSASSDPRAPASTAPRPARISGRSLRSTRSAAAATSAAAGRVRGALNGPGRLGLGALAELLLQVDRQRQHDRDPLALGARRRAGHVLDRRRAAAHALDSRAERARRALDVDRLADVAAARGLPHHEQQRRALLDRLGQRGQRVREARPLVRGGDAEPVRRLRVGVGGADRRPPRGAPTRGGRRSCARSGRRTGSCRSPAARTACDGRADASVSATSSYTCAGSSFTNPRPRRPSRRSAAASPPAGRR